MHDNLSLIDLITNLTLVRKFNRNSFVFFKCLDVRYSTNCGRAKTKNGDYTVAQAGEGAHLSTSAMSTQASFKALAHNKQ